MKKKKQTTPIIDDSQIILMTHGEIKEMQDKIIYYTIPLLILDKMGQPINFTDILESHYNISPTKNLSWEQIIALIKQRGTPEKANKEQ